MPCRTDYPDDGPIIQEREEKFNHDSAVADHLCFVMKYLTRTCPPRAQRLMHDNPALKSWWKDHKKMDARKKKDRQRAIEDMKRKRAKLDKEIKKKEEENDI